MKQPDFFFLAHLTFDNLKLPIEIIWSSAKVTVVAKACREQEPPPATATKYAEVACNEGEARSVFFNFMVHF